MVVFWWLAAEPESAQYDRVDVGGEELERERVQSNFYGTLGEVPSTNHFG